MDPVSIAIIVVVSVSGFYFHWWLYVRIKRWINRDLALSMAGGNKAMQGHMLERLQEAEKRKVSKKDLHDWLQEAAEDYRKNQ